ncbi:MAG TPA: hypothetical protein VGH14_14915 [Solirubrobacterales bacterium]|jgi:hypothetical protein
MIFIALLAFLIRPVKRLWQRRRGGRAGEVATEAVDVAGTALDG